MPLRNLVSHHRIAADPYGVLDMLFHTERHSTSETVLQFIVTAVNIYCVTAYTAAILTDSLMPNAELKEICFTLCVLPSECISTTGGPQCCAQNFW